MLLFSRNAQDYASYKMGVDFQSQTAEPVS